MRVSRFSSAVVPALAALSLIGCKGSRPFDWTGGRPSEATAGMASRHSPAAPDSADHGEVAGGEAAPAAPPEAVDVLFINDDSITVDDVLGPIRAELTAKIESLPLSERGDALVRTLRDRIRSMARETLLYQEASRRLTEQENEQLDKFTDQRVRDIVQRDYGGRQVRWEQAMAEQGLSPEKARDRVRRELVIVRHLQQVISPRIQEPTRRELVRFYEERKEELTVPERRELLLIEVLKGDDPAQARAAIEQALAELEAGAEFGEVARKHSRGPHADSGGNWGLVDPRSIQGRWAQAARTLAELPPGGTSGVVEGDQSFFIVRVGGIEPRKEPAFSEIQLQLKAGYRDQQFDLLVDELVGRLQERAVIRPADLSLFLQATVAASLQQLGQ